MLLHGQNLRFAEDIDLLGGSEEALQRLENTDIGYGMEISSDKDKLLVNSIKPRPSTNIWMNGKHWKKWDNSNALDPHRLKTEHQ